MTADDDGALFGTETVAALAKAGDVETSLTKALDRGYRAGRLVRDVDEPLAESALVLARALDTGDRIGGLKGGYLVAQAQPAFQKACHALRLPTELTAATPPAPAADSHTSTPDWLRDAFGTPE